MNRRRLVVVVDGEIYIYDISTMKLLHTVTTGPNPEGLCSLAASEHSLFAYATAGTMSNAPGDIFVYDALSLELVIVVHAHRTPIACVAINSDASLLATASDKGTIVRVFALPQGRLVHQFRRGTYSIHIQSITFSGDSSFLCVTSESGTVHLFRMCGLQASAPEDALARKRRLQLSSVAGALGEMLPTSLTEAFEPERAFAYFKVPSPAPAVAAISATLPIVLAAAADGCFYTYAIDLERGGECKFIRRSTLLV